MKKHPLPSAERLHELLIYDAVTGELVRKVDKPPAKKGDRITYVNSFGHIQLKIDRKTYVGHRIIWKMVTGRDPVEEIDHIDGKPSRNVWENLREASRVENMVNRKMHRNNTSGIKGVSFKKQIGKWYASISLDGQRHQLGYFDLLEDAAAAVAIARAELHGAFARAA